MTKRMIIALLVLALVGGGLVGFNIFRDRMIAQFLADRPEQVLPVETVLAEAVVWRPTLQAIGTINAAQGVELTVEAAGIVRAIAFEANADVQAGELLLQMDDEVQQADLTAAQTQLALERANLAREQELQSRGVASDARLDQIRAAFDAATAQVARAEAVIGQRRLVAPFDGTIGLSRVDRGAYVSPGTAVATLQDLDTMRVDFSLPEQALPQLAIGQRLHVRVDGDPRSFDGEITGIDPRVDPGSRLVAVRARIDNPDRALTPGQFARVRIDLPEEDGVIALPQTAVTTSLFGDFAFVVRDRDGEDDTLEARQVFVTLGRRDGGRVEVTEGIAPGDRVVSSGQNRLSNRSAVSLAETETPRPGPGDEMPADGDAIPPAEARP
ncbi:efflux RND transporter periplasmic adaptor subunit [Rhodobaculum claviforme]|uniref:Efflux transporter periplasmic adaptor subunit n=1 Tax=Rhodobaculum claviforme TaxID=1549854 RepID=A0A934TLF9_9RHOB|nr:efflux RND transporter periplasmic adaptor subunit [Rhodobaculum claviforme]MBK5927729.1 efflux transporter periplasmic adaptor subunit [Rhodobaculum claviforme]